MKKKWLWLVCAVLLGASGGLRAQGSDTLRVEDGLYLVRLTDFVYVWTSYKQMEGYGNVGANGLLVAVDKKAMLIDSPWDEPRTERLCKYITDSMHLELIIAVVTHAHDDRIGGIGYLKRQYIPVYALESTTMEAKRLNIPRPDIIFNDSLSLNFVGVQVLLLDPGPGHTHDNMVVWIPVERVLYGGCFIRDGAATDLGNLSEADPKSWLESAGRVSTRFPEAVYVVPGHGKPGGPELIQHTIELLQNYKAADH